MLLSIPAQDDGASSSCTALTKNSWPCVVMLGCVRFTVLCRAVPCAFEFRPLYKWRHLGAERRTKLSTSRGGHGSRIRAKPNSL